MTGVEMNERSADSLVRANPGFEKTRTRLSALRSVLARERAAVARAALADCRLCAHDCGVNRLAGPAGVCHAGADARFFSAQVEVSDELELIPTFAIALSGCDLRCDFCITGGPSWNPRLGVEAAPRRLEGGGDAPSPQGGCDAPVATGGGGAAATLLRRGVAATLIARANAALANGARTVMILGGEPTVHLHTALEIVAALPEDAKLVWKTNAHGSASARELLDGMFDVWLADYKFGNDACAQRLAKVPDYNRVVRENLIWFAGREEFLTTKKQSNEGQLCSFVPSLFNLRGELIVRHLLMPGHIECCWRPVAKWLAENLPGVKVNLRSGFWPAWHAARHSELRGTVSKLETESAWALARECGLNLVT